MQKPWFFLIKFYLMLSTGHKKYKTFEMNGPLLTQVINFSLLTQFTNRDFFCLLLVVDLCTSQLKPSSPPSGQGGGLYTVWSHVSKTPTSRVISPRVWRKWQKFLASKPFQKMTILSSEFCGRSLLQSSQNSFVKFSLQFFRIVWDTNLNVTVFQIEWSEKKEITNNPYVI